MSAVSGLGTLSDTWNATSCTPTANVTTENENKTLTSDIVTYLKSPNRNPTKLNEVYKHISKRGGRSTSMGPLLQIGSPSSGGIEFSLEFDSNTKISDIGSVIKIKNRRIAAFPGFIMKWLSDQTNEIMSSLFTPPNLIIIPPTSFGQNAQFDGSFKHFTQDLGAAYSKATVDNIKQGMNTSFYTKTNTP